MTRLISRCVLALSICAIFICPLYAQGDSGPGKNKPATEKKTAKPFKILTSGKQITIKSTDNNNSLKQILVWTSSGNRIVEQHDLDVASYEFTINVNENIFFLLLEMKDGSRHTQKFGLRE